MPMPINAVVYIPSADLDDAAARCLEHGKTCGYHIEGLIIGRWDDAQAMAIEGVVQVVIVADRSHLPPGRVPRIEVAGETPGTMCCRCRRVERPPSPMERRPRLVD